MSGVETSGRDEDSQLRERLTRNYTRSSGQQWRVITWACWTVAAVGIGVGPLAVLLLAGLPVAGVIWFVVAVIALAWVGPAVLDWIEMVIPGPVRRDEYALLLPDHAEYLSVPATRLHEVIAGHVAGPVVHADGGPLRWWFTQDPSDARPSNPLADAVLERFIRRGFDRAGHDAPVGGFRGPVVVTRRPGPFGNVGLDSTARDALDTLVTMYRTGEAPPGAMTREDILAALVNNLTAVADRLDRAAADTNHSQGQGEPR